MKYIITNNSNNAVFQRRVFARDPRTTTPLIGFTQGGRQVHELTDAEGDALQLELDALFPRDLPVYDAVGKTINASRAVDQVAGRGPRAQFDGVLAGFPLGIRQRFVTVLAPYYGPSNWTGAKTALAAFDVSGESAEVQQLKADIDTVLDRLIAG